MLRRKPRNISKWQTGPSLKSKQRCLRGTNQPGRSWSLGVNSCTLSGPTSGTGSSQIFTTNELENQLEQLEKMAKEVLGPKKTQKTKLRRVKKHLNKEKAIAEQYWKNLCEFIEKHNFETLMLSQKMILRAHL